MTARQKRLARQARAKQLDEWVEQRLQQPEDEEEEIQRYFAQMLEECRSMIDDDHMVRSITYRDFSYNIYEIPYDGELWYVAINNEGDAFRGGIDFECVIKSCEQWLQEMICRSKMHKYWDPEDPVGTSYTLQ